LQAGITASSYDTYVQSRQSYISRRQSGLLNTAKDNLRQTHTELYPGTSFDPLEPLHDGSLRTSEHYKLMYFPFGQDKTWEDLTPIQEMALYCNLIRDRYHLALLNIWQNDGRNGESVFDTHGTPHNVSLEMALRQMTNLRVESYIGWAACRQFLGLSAEYQHVRD